MIEFKKKNNTKKISENKNLNKIVNIIEKILDFHKQKGKGLPSDLVHIVKVTDLKHIKILTAKQMIQRLPTTLSQVKAGNTSENLLNEIMQIIYCLYWANEVTKKVYNNIMNSTKLWNRVDTIFMNSENSKTSDPQGLLLNLSDKINLRQSHKYVALLNLSIYYIWKNI